MKGRKAKGLITEKGRECSKCGLFRFWEFFAKSGNLNAFHGRASRCKKCNKQPVTERVKVNTRATCRLDKKLIKFFLKFGFR